MEKVDFKKQHKDLYAPSKTGFEHINVPPMQFVMIDGAGPPGNTAYVTACNWLFPISYGIKFMSKNTLARDYVVLPLEGLWWADDFSAYTEDRRDEWKWTLMIRQPDWITPQMFEAALENTVNKQGSVPRTLRFQTYDEGLSVQTLHIGPFSEEAPKLAYLHDRYLPQNGLKETGHHHEIYLSDPRKTAPEKLRTILRQPVQRL